MTRSKKKEGEGRDNIKELRAMNCMSKDVIKRAVEDK